MSKKDKMMMPQSTAGLVRYFDESKESIKIKPEHVVIACVVLSAVVLAMRFMA